MSEGRNKKNSAVKTIAFMVVVFGLAMLTMYLIEKPGRASESAISQNTPRVLPATKPALGIQIPTLQYTSDVQQYMRDCLTAPIPAEYRLPQDIMNAENYDIAVYLVGKHFPQFNNLEGPQLIEAVRKDPFEYQKMILEGRAVREKFFPGSQVRQPVN